MRHDLFRLTARPNQNRAPRIAIVTQGDPTDPGAWSGIPVGLSAGLREAGAEPVPIDARPPAVDRLLGRLRVPWTWETTNRPYSALTGAWAVAAMRRAGGIDGAVAIGSGFELKTAVPTATLEDLTVAQAIGQPFSPASSLRPRAAGRWRERQRRSYLQARGCCTSSHWAARSVRDDYGIDPDKIHVVGFGRNFAPRPGERDWSVPRYVFVGVEWERKGGPELLEAFAAVRQVHAAAELDLVGGHPPIEAPGVTCHGRLALGSPDQRAQLERLLSRATCLVVPSHFEAFGIVYVDAGAAGVPSIGTTEGGADDAIGAGGVLVPPGNTEALTEAMLHLADPGIARDLGELAIANSARFTWRVVAERLLRVLRPPGIDRSQLAEFV